MYIKFSTPSGGGSVSLNISAVKQMNILTKQNELR